MSLWLKRPAPTIIPATPAVAPEPELKAATALVRALTEGLVIVRAADQTVVALNARAEHLIGRPEAQAIGQPLPALLPSANGHALISRPFEMGEALPGYQLLGVEEAHVSTLPKPGRRDRASAMELLQAVTVAANEASRVEDVTQFALERLCQYSGWPVGHVYLLGGQENRELMPAALWYVKEAERFEAFQVATTSTRLRPGEDLVGAALLSGQPEYWPDLQTPGFLRQAPARRCGLKAGCALPVLVGSQVVGVLEVYTDDAAAAPEALLEVAGPLGTLLGRVYERIELQREQARKAQMLARNETAILNILSDLKQSHDELQTAQLQLIQVAKLESVGRLAAGVAHEVKNPLAIILMGVAYLAKQGVIRDNEKLADVLKDIHDAVVRADGVIKGLLEFSASRGLSLSPHDPVDMIQKSLALVKHEFVKANVAAIAELEDHLPLVAMDRTKLEQVLVNLFINAVHAMPQGGRLTVRAARRKLTEVGMGVGQRRSDRFRVGQTVLAIEVDDTGTGIPADKLTKVFDPFFTTKPPGQGTGLGLSVTRNIVELHQGTITVANRSEGGVRVTMLLPLGEEASAHAA